MCLATIDHDLTGWAWQTDEQIHLTVRFIGEVERPVAEDLAAALAATSSAPIAITLSGVGHFDHGNRSALFARVEPRGSLQALHEKIDRILVRCNRPPERRSYLPHITLARRHGYAADPSPWLVRHAGLSSKPSVIDHLTLFESHLTRGGATYEAITRYPLDRAG